jgi:hypothetical protein
METTVECICKDALAIGIVLPISNSVALLYRINVEKLNNRIRDAFEYNRQLFALPFEADLMETRVNGDNMIC